MNARSLHIYKPKEFFKLLNSLGFYYHHTNGSHQIFANVKGYFVTIPCGGKKELNGVMTKLALQRIDRGLCDRLDKDTIKRYKKSYFKESGNYIQI